MHTTNAGAAPVFLNETFPGRAGGNSQLVGSLLADRAHIPADHQPPTDGGIEKLTEHAISAPSNISADNELDNRVQSYDLSLIGKTGLQNSSTFSPSTLEYAGGSNRVATSITTGSVHNTGPSHVVGPNILADPFSLPSSIPQHHTHILHPPYAGTFNGSNNTSRIHIPVSPHHQPQLYPYGMEPYYGEIIPNNDYDYARTGAARTPMIAGNMAPMPPPTYYNMPSYNAPGPMMRFDPSIGGVGSKVVGHQFPYPMLRDVDSGPGKQQRLPYASSSDILLQHQPFVPYPYHPYYYGVPSHQMPMNNNIGSDKFSPIILQGMVKSSTTESPTARRNREVMLQRGTATVSADGSVGRKRKRSVKDCAYKCAVKGCSFKTAYIGHYNRHSADHATDVEKSFKCDFPNCIYSTSRAGYLRSHQLAKKHLPKPLSNVDDGATSLNPVLSEKDVTNDHYNTNIATKKYDQDAASPSEDVIEDNFHPT